MMRRLICVAVVGALSISCGSKTSPTAASTTSSTTTPTRIISLGGALDFGAIQVGQSFNANFDIRNTGNSPLTITSLSSPFANTNFAASFTSGTIAAGGSQTVTVRFSPTFAQTYSGTLTVNGDQTSGTNTININATGSLTGLPTFSKSGTGDTVFDLPKYGISRLKVVGTYNQNSSNFIVKIDGRLLVNELLGTGWSQTRYEGTLLSGLTSTSAGTIAITNSSGVAWSFEEVR